MRLAHQDGFVRLHLPQATLLEYITIASIPFWIGKTFSTWKWIPFPPTCLLLATRWRSWSSPTKRPSLLPSSTSSFPATTRRSTPPTTNANRAFSKWNGKQTGLWVSIVRPTAAGARRATKPAAKASARNLNVLQTRQSGSGENRGFCVVANKVLTYA